jgi:hypothetical protein
MNGSAHRALLRIVKTAIAVMIIIAYAIVLTRGGILHLPGLRR